MKFCLEAVKYVNMHKRFTYRKCTVAFYWPNIHKYIMTFLPWMFWLFRPIKDKHVVKHMTLNCEMTTSLICFWMHSDISIICQQLVCATHQDKNEIKQLQRKQCRLIWVRLQCYYNSVSNLNNQMNLSINFRFYCWMQKC